jgi:AraC-like DNA-binding protein
VIFGDLTPNRTPLHRFPLLHAGAPDAMRGDPTHARAAGGFELPGCPGEFAAVGNFVRLRSMGLAYLSCSGPVRAHCAGINAVRQQFCLQGSAVTSFGSQTLQVDADRPCLIPAHSDAIFAFERDFTQLVLYVDTDALRSTLSGLIGIPISQTIAFATPTDPNRPELRRLRPLIGYFVSELDRDDSRLSEPAFVELEQTLLVSFLHANRHNFSHLLERDLRRSPPRQVRRAEEFIEANWNRPLTAEAISAATGVGMRSLLEAFRRARGYSPMAFVKRVRLMKAREMLMRPAENTSVAAVACACGFDNPGHFSGNYRRAFGELPSQTLTKVKGPAYQSLGAPC